MGDLTTSMYTRAYDELKEIALGMALRCAMLEGIMDYDKAYERAEQLFEEGCMRNGTRHPLRRAFWYQFGQGVWYDLMEENP